MSDLSAEKVVAELPITPEDLRTIAKYACWDKFEDRYTSDPKKHPAWRAADLIAHQAARLEESRAIYDEQVTRAENQWKAWEARATAAEAEVGRLLRESISLSALIDLTKGCQHDGGFDREIGPIGCSLGDGCVCCGIVMGARACLSSKKEG